MVRPLEKLFLRLPLGKTHIKKDSTVVATYWKVAVDFGDVDELSRLATLQPATERPVYI